MTFFFIFIASKYINKLYKFKLRNLCVRYNKNQIFLDYVYFKTVFVQKSLMRVGKFVFTIIIFFYVTPKSLNQRQISPAHILLKKKNTNYNHLG